MARARKKSSVSNPEVIPSIALNGRTFRFPSDLFDLDTHNIGRLNEQIAHLPAEMANVGEALAEAKESLSRVSSEFDMWRVRALASVGDEKGRLTGDAKKGLVVKNTTSRNKWEEYEEEIREASKLVAILYSYFEATKTKANLAQTLSRNLSLERGEWGKGRSA